MIFAVLLLIVGLLVCLSDWRRGIYMVVLAGFLQDPIRKVIPGEPVLATMIAPALFGVCFVMMLISEGNLGFQKLNRFSPVLFLPSILFVGWVVFSTLLTYATTSSLVLAGIGAMDYLAPIPALMIGYRFAGDVPGVLRLLVFYVVIATIFAVSISMESSGVNWPILGSIGEGFVFYPESGGIAILRSGFFRSPELAGWHAAAAICFLVIIGIARKADAKFLLSALVVIAIVLPALVLAGRRKFLIEIVMFLAFAATLITYFRTQTGRLALISVLVALVSAGFFFYTTSSELPGEWMPYVDRSASVSGDAGTRFKHMTVDMFQYVIAKNGFWGSGAGTGSQGAQHFGGGAILVGAAAEGGLGKVLAELGVPGLILLTLVLAALGRYIWMAAESVRGDKDLAALSYGIFAFLAANVIVFTTAHQIFGDINILILLGLLLGILLRSPDLLIHDVPAAPPPKKRRIGRRFAARET